MRNRMSISRRAAMVAAFFAGGLLLVPTARASAQATIADGGWNAYLGCWEPAGAPSGVKASLLCVVPAQGASAVDLVTVTDGKEVAREHINANGEHVATTRDGCKGWESAEWSGDGERVYLHADFTCGAMRQRSTALIAMSANGDLMDVQGLKAGKNNGVRVTQYREATDPGPLPADIASAIGARTMAVDAARVSAAAPISTDNVIEASAHLDAPVVEAWLANRGDPMAVDAKQLEALAKGGVPGDVIDVMVALANPQRFAINPALGGAGGQYGDAVAPSRLNGVVGSSNANAPARPICPYSAYGWDYGSACMYSPWTYGFSPYGYPYGLYSPYSPYNPYFGYAGGYNYGYGYGYGGWYGGQPVIVVTNNGQTASHGRVVKGRGYVQGSPPPSSVGSSGMRAPARSSGAAAGSSGAGAASSGHSSGSSTGRTAHRSGGGGAI